MPKPSPLPDNLADCHALILEQREVAARLQEKREQLEREIDALNAIDSKPPENGFVISDRATRCPRLPTTPH